MFCLSCNISPRSAGAVKGKAGVILGQDLSLHGGDSNVRG